MHTSARLLAVAVPLAALLGAVVACPPVPPAENCPPGKCSATQQCVLETGECVALPACDAAHPCAVGRCVSGVCTSCDTNLVCELTYTRCDGTSNACARCASGSECGGALPMCSPTGCAECVADSDCPSGKPHCLDFWCQQCRTNSDCSAGLYCQGGACRDACDGGSCTATPGYFCGYNSLAGRQVCVQCRTSADCPATEACYEGTCRAALEGDRCSNAVPIALGSGSAVLTAELVYYSDEWPEGEFPWSTLVHRDAYFRIDATQPSELTAWTYVAPRFPFSAGVAVVELYTGTCGALTRVTDHVTGVYVPAGTYYLRVYDEDSSVGVIDFDLHVQLTPATRTQGNTCFAPIPVALDGGLGHVTGDTAGLAPVHALGCPSTAEAQPGLAYTVNVPVRSAVRYHVTPLSPELALNAVLRPNCFVEGEVYECMFARDAGVDILREHGPLPPGDYELLVRNAPDAGGPFEADIHVIPWATNETCATALPLEFVGGTAVAVADTRYTGQLMPTCSGAASDNALNYTFSTVGQGARSLRVVTTAQGYSPEVTLAKVCAPSAASGDIVHCGSYGPTSWDLPVLPEGDYYLQVTGYGTGGPTRLEVTLGPPYPPPANDSCADAGTFDLSVTNPVTVSGDTRGATSENYVCGGPYPGRDVAYKFATPAKGSVRITVVGTSPGFDPRISLDGCGGGTCFNAADGGTETAVFTMNAYSNPLEVIVAGAPLAAGTFDLTAQFTPPPANDVCGTGVPSLAVPQTVTGDLVGYYGEANRCTTNYGPDIWYQLRTSADTPVTLTLTPDAASFDSVLQVVTSCSSTTGTCVASANGQSDPNGVSTVSFTALRNTTYYVAVGGVAWSVGGWTLDVR